VNRVHYNIRTLDNSDLKGNKNKFDLYTFQHNLKTFQGARKKIRVFEAFEHELLTTVVVHAFETRLYIEKISHRSRGIYFFRYTAVGIRVELVLYNVIIFV